MDVTETRVLPTAVGREFEALAVSPTLQIEAIRGFVSERNSYVWVTKAIEEIVNTPRYLEELGSYSFEHPNGFDWIPLELNLPQYRARIHIWWPERAGVIEDIHNHAWDFASRILCGSLRFITFEIGDDGTPHYHYPRYQHGSDAPKQTDDRIVSLRKTFDGCLPSGTCYSFSHTELHRVTAEGACLSGGDVRYHWGTPAGWIRRVFRQETKRRLSALPGKTARPRQPSPPVGAPARRT